MLKRPLQNLFDIVYLAEMQLQIILPRMNLQKPFKILDHQPNSFQDSFFKKNCDSFLHLKVL